MSESNTRKGRDFLLEIFDEDDSLWKQLGGLRSRDWSADNPVADTTSASTEGDFTESDFNGYATITLNGSGVMDVRSNEGLAAYKYFERKAMTGNRRARLRASSPENVIEGVFTITSYSSTAEQQGQIEYSLSAQSASGVSYV